VSQFCNVTILLYQYSKKKINHSPDTPVQLNYTTHELGYDIPGEAMSWMCGVVTLSSSTRKNTAVNHTALRSASTTPAVEVWAYFHKAIMGIR